MNSEFKIALEKKRILPFSAGKKLIGKELEAAKQDLIEAKDRQANGKFKYSTITAYYSMFHSARALLYQAGYREKSHHYLSVSLEALYVESGKMTPKLARAFKNAMILREEADYHGDFSEEGAQIAMESAEEFLQVARKILNRKF